MRKSPIVVAAVVVALMGASAALAHDAIALRILDGQKQVEALSTTSVVLGGDLKPMRVVVSSAQGRMRDVNVIIMDMRAAYRPAFLAYFSQPNLYGEPDQKRLIKAHPVVRITGKVDCETGRAMWTSLDYSDTTVAAASSTRALNDPANNGNLPQYLADDARISVCATKPANA